MIEKIDLYREVLAIEPNSKVFFPLARALAESGRPDEAMAVLETGIGFHPDHLEAKFLLVELYAAQDREEDAARIFSGVQDSLVRYPAVWRLWARHAAFSSRDPVVALSFLAQFFRDPGLTFAGVLEKGLEALAGAPLSGAVPDQPAAREAAPEESGPRAPAGEPETAPAFPAAPPAPAAEQAAAVEPVAEAVPPAPAGLSEETALNGEEEVGMPLRGAQEVWELAEALGMEEGGEAAGSTGLAEPAELAERAEPSERAPGKPREASSAGTPVRTVQIPDMGIRTRTMAALLAAQGDVSGALDIYREVLPHLPAGPERAEVEAAIAALAPAAPAPVAQETGHEPPPGAVQAKSRGKARLMGLLDALAGRLEARAGA